MTGFLDTVKSALGFKPEVKSFSLSDDEAFSVFGGISNIGGLSFSAAGAMRNPAVACAVALISETAGTLPVKLFERDTKATAKDHPAYHLIHDEANPWTSAEALRTTLTADALLHGAGYAVAVRAVDGTPLELHRLDPASVQFKHDEYGEPFYLLNTAGGTVRYAYTEILHIQPFFDASPISLGREALSTAAALSSHLSKLLANGASPGGIITAPKTVGDEAKVKLKKAWTDTHSGPKSGGVALLDEGMAYQQITMTLTDAQFSENRLEQIHEVARIFRVPPTMLFELSRSTWSNAEEMQRQFIQTTLRPWFNKWQAAYARVLLTPEERRAYYVEFITEDLSTVKLAERATAYGQFRSMGAMTANEVRGGLNLPAHAEGDTLQNPYTTTGANDAAKKESQDA